MAKLSERGRENDIDVTKWSKENRQREGRNRKKGRTKRKGRD